MKVKKNICMLLILVILLNSSPIEVVAATCGTKQKLHPIPSEAMAEDVSKPDHIIGNGTPESCTESAFIEAVAEGGVIVFNGGDEPFTIHLSKPAKVFNNKPDVVIDGGGLVTLDGSDSTRILYMNTCDPNQIWTTPHCNNQDAPHLTVQNITFANGNSTRETEYTGGGAIFVRGGRFKVVNCQFINNKCSSSGPDVGGGAIRVFDQYNDEPVYIVNSTFGGAEGLGNSGSNGGAISSIGVSFTIINSVFSFNKAVGNGGNPAEYGTPGGGSGGAIYNDGNRMTLTLLGTVVEHNTVNAYGSGIFFVSNDHSGNIVMDNSYVRDNIGGSWYPVHENISMHGDTKITIDYSELYGVATSEMSTLIIDGNKVDIPSYAFFGHYYYKLRDIAMLLMDSNKAFDVRWNSEKKEVELDSEGMYKPMGTELDYAILGLESDYGLYEPKLTLNQEVVDVKTYLVEGYNYFMLRDLAEMLDFRVTWDGTLKSVIIDTSSNYLED